MPTAIRFDTEWGNILRDITTVRLRSRTLEKEFIEIASKGIILVLKENTPTASGDLSRSWKVFERSSKMFVVGSDMPDLVIQQTEGVRPQTIHAKNAKAMHFFIGGEEFFRSKVDIRGTAQNEFVMPIIQAMDFMLQALVMSLIKQHWKIFKTLRAKKITMFNLSRTVGLSTGTKRNTRRGRGGGVQKAKTGRKSFKRTLSRRRRTGRFITTQKTEVKAKS